LKGGFPVGEEITLRLSGEAFEALTRLSDSLGFSPEMTAEYAIRLVAACAREGLIADTPLRAWPREAREQAGALRGTGTGGKVLAFPGGEPEE